MIAITQKRTVSKCVVGLAFLCTVVLAWPVEAQTCRASYYGFESGRTTANGEHFNPSGLTAAHRTLPFGTRVRVSYGGRSVVVRISDRGPAAYTGRCIDLAKGAAVALGMIRVGVAPVQVEVMK